MLEPHDGGPIYTETDMRRLVAEPWNAGTALAFLALAVFWLVRLRGRYREHAFLLGCLPLLLVGGAGGTLYHAFRRSYLCYLLDVVPIGLLAVAVSLSLWVRFSRRWWYLILVLPPYLAVAALPRAESSHAAINAAYVLLAVLILLPTLLVLRISRFRGAGWVGLALGLFGVALFFRWLDTAHPPALLPMGTHWLWHLFGAATTGCLAEWLYRLGPIERLGRRFV
jgi:hemolysin III